MNTLFINSGSFSDYGGWVLDTQFIEVMASEYLLAHGTGTPVADCCTAASLPQSGTYRLWVRTKDWLSPWQKDNCPGTFKIKINDTLLSPVIGNDKKDWHWQDAGIIALTNPDIKITVCDLTGFDGRFSSLFFTDDLDFIPEAFYKSDVEFNNFRDKHDPNWKDIIKLDSYELAVMGGGITGICAALSASRNGVKTLLVQDRGVVGGNNSSEVRVWLGGETNLEPFPNIGNIVKELEQKNIAHYGPANTADLYEDDRKMSLLTSQKNLDILTGYAVYDAQTQGNKITTAILYNVKNGRRYSIAADNFCDCTGDGVLAFKANADCEMTTNGHMGMTNMWNVKEEQTAQAFPDISEWSMSFGDNSFPGRRGRANVYGEYGADTLGSWYWESGMEFHPVWYAERARDNNFWAAYSAIHTLKNVDKDYENYKLNYLAYIGGKRESRRFFGDVILTKSEVFNQKQYPDACLPLTWNFDVHYPDRSFYPVFTEGDAFLTFDYHEDFTVPYFMPYRCLYSRNIKNLFIAGRNTSVSHEALGSARVMRTCGMMGEIVGIAAKLCKKYNAPPRDVYYKYLDEFVSIIKT